YRASPHRYTARLPAGRRSRAPRGAATIRVRSSRSAARRYLTSNARGRWIRAARVGRACLRRVQKRTNTWFSPRRPCPRKRRHVDPAERSAARQAAEWRVIDAHPAMPLVELLEEIWIDLEEI